MPPVTLTPIATGFNNPVGIDYHEPTDQVILSVNYPTGQPSNFELVARDGTRQPFTTISGFTDEVKIATVRSGPQQGGFTVGEVFTGNGTPAEIVRISPDGTAVANPWLTLKDAAGVADPGLLRGSLFQDRYGVFGGDLIVVTNRGGVWRVTSAGAATRVANLDTHLEGVTTVPDLPRYGPWAGKIVVGAEQRVPPAIFAVDAAGNYTVHELGISPEDIEIIPAGENFVGVDFGGRQLLGAPTSEFAGMVGDFLIAQEQGGGVLWHVRWDPASGNFQTEQVARVEHWEHVTFAPVGFPLFEYAVKFICGTSRGDVVAPGVYYTAINVHNPTNTAVGFRKKFAVALPNERSARPTGFFDARLGPDEALEIDCPDIVRHLREAGMEGEFFKGFAVIQSKVELDVVAVYTAAGATGQVETLHTERVPARQVGLESPTEEPPPTEPAQLA
jgi:hypothetical protein